MVILNPNRKSHIEWVLQNYKLHGKDFSFEDHPFLLDIYLDEYPEQVYQKSAQVGISEFLISLGYYVCAELQGVTLYLFPTTNHIGDFVQHRIDPTIEQSPLLRKMVNFSYRKGKKGANKVRLKRIGNGFLYFRGTKSRMDVTSTPGDLVNIDEFDECTIANIPLAIERMHASNLKWVRKASTPWFPDGPIESEFKNSDKRTWHVMCESCGEVQNLTWNDNVVREHQGINELNSSYLPYIPRDPRISERMAEAIASNNWREVISSMDRDMNCVCRKCSKPIDRLSEGQWIPEFPSKSVHGWHIHRLFSKKVKLAELYSKFIRSHAKIDELTTFYRQALGLGYDASGLGLTKAILERLSQIYDPDSIKPDFVSAGVDVGSVFHVQISKNSVARFPVLKATFKTREEVEEVLRAYNVNICVVDIEPETRVVEELRNNMGEMVYLCKFGYNPDGSKLADGQNDTDHQYWYEIDYAVQRIFANRTISIDRATSDMLQARTVIHKSWIDDLNWVSQICNPKRQVIEDMSGKKKAVWTRTAADHFRLADVYDFLAMTIFKSQHSELSSRPSVQVELKDIYEESFSMMDTDKGNEYDILKKLGFKQNDDTDFPGIITPFARGYDEY